MTQTEIIEGNKLIAEFMGVQTTSNYTDAAFDDRLWCVSDLKYQQSWDRLIPVCKKASDIAINQPNRPSVNHCSRLDWLESDISIAMRDYEIEKVWQAVIEFIKWYNQQKATT